jgi:PAS domain S-box-containing protein
MSDKNSGDTPRERAATDASAQPFSNVLERHESEERYRSLVEATSDWIWEVDENAIYTYSSPNVRDLLGYEPEELLGKTPFDLMPPAEARRAAEILTTKQPLFSFENVNLHKDGREVVLETSATPIFDAQGAFRGYRGIDRDITERKQVEAERARLIAILEATPDFVATADASGRVLYYNQAARRMLGIGATEDISGISIPDTHPAWSTAIVLDEGLPTAARDGIWRGETALLSRDGWEIPISQVILAHRAPDGEVQYFSTIGRDITEQKRTERFREDYIQAVTHDLRAPLSVIGMQAQVLQAALKGTASQRQADGIWRGVERMNLMIQELADSVRLEGGQLRLQPQPLELHSFVTRLLEEGGAMLYADRIRLEIPPELPPVNADLARLERILMNLLNNALKYSPPDTPVVVSARRYDDEVTVAVVDRGVGIGPEDLPHIFERFYRASQARGTEGLGLGLYVTRMMIEAHGGRVWVESKAGQGSTFYFTLPTS